MSALLGAGKEKKKKKKGKIGPRTLKIYEAVGAFYNSVKEMESGANVI